MVGLLLRLRWLAAIVAVFCALDALAFVALGIMRGFTGLRLLVEGPPWTGEHLPGIELARSLDSFLMAMVFFMFSIGMTTLFIARPDDPALDSIPAWMRVRSLTDLKLMLWEAILLVLVVASVESFVVTGAEAQWTALTLPVAVLILAVGLYLARRSH